MDFHKTILSLSFAAIAGIASVSQAQSVGAGAGLNVGGTSQSRAGSGPGANVGGTVHGSGAGTSAGVGAGASTGSTVRPGDVNRPNANVGAGGSLSSDPATRKEQSLQQERRDTQRRMDRERSDTEMGGRSETRMRMPNP